MARPVGLRVKGGSGLEKAFGEGFCIARHHRHGDDDNSAEFCAHWGVPGSRTLSATALPKYGAKEFLPPPLSWRMEPGME